MRYNQRMGDDCLQVESKLSERDVLGDGADGITIIGAEPDRLGACQPVLVY